MSGKLKIDSLLISWKNILDVPICFEQLYSETLWNYFIE